MTHHLVELEDIAIQHWLDRLRMEDWDWLTCIGRWVNLCDSIRRRTQRAKEMDKANA